MYAKVFAQILDSSIANDYQLRHFFTDMLVLAEIDGVVDMTHEAVSARTRIPLEMVVRFIAELEKPDPKSRSHKEDGRRIVRLDPLRDWGWRIVNYLEYRRIASEEQRREKTRERVKRFKENHKVTQGNAGVTLANAGNAMQRQRQRQKNKKEEHPALPENLRRDDFEKSWGEWTGHLKEKKSKPTPSALQKQIAFCSTIGATRAIIAINHSIEHNWQGIYEPKENQNGNGTPPVKPTKCEFDKSIDRLTAKIMNPKPNTT